MSWNTLGSIVTAVVTWLSFGFHRQVSVFDYAPDFQGVSTNGLISLSDLCSRGPVILAFYYADFTPG